MKNIVCDIGLHSDTLTDDEIAHLISVEAIYLCEGLHTIKDQTARIFHLSSNNRDPTTYFFLALTEYKQRQARLANDMKENDLRANSRFHTPTRQLGDDYKI